MTMKTCPTCHGYGQASEMSNGQRVYRACYQCGGAGKVYVNNGGSTRDPHQPHPKKQSSFNNFISGLVVGVLYFSFIGYILEGKFGHYLPSNFIENFEYWEWWEKTLTYFFAGFLSHLIGILAIILMFSLPIIMIKRLIKPSLTKTGLGATVADKIKIPGNKYKILRTGKVLVASFFPGFLILIVLLLLERFLFGYEPGSGPVSEYSWLVFLIATISMMPLMDKNLT